MRSAYTEKCAEHLGGDIGRSVAPANTPLGGISKGYRRLKCAPEIGPNAKIKVVNAAPVASVFASNAMPMFPPASFSPMIAEHTTVAKSNAVPRASAATRRERVIGKALSGAAAGSAARRLGLVRPNKRAN